MVGKRIPVSPRSSKAHGSAAVRVDPAVLKFNRINSVICSLLPATVRAYDTVRSLLPFMREMQGLLSQRPKQKVTLETTGFEVLRMAGLVLTTVPITSPSQLPTWSFWLSSWARELDYSVRHLQRLVFNERPKEKYVKECGWNGPDHTRAAAVANLGVELARAVKAGAPTTEMVDEILKRSGGLPDPEWQIRTPLRRRPARRTVSEGVDINLIA